MPDISDHESQTLPRLRSGLTMLERPERRSPALHRLALAELGRRDGETFWIDARNEASTYALYDLAPSRTRLDGSEQTRRLRASSDHWSDGVQVARAFTAYQHHSLVRTVARQAASDTALVVAPCLTSLYRDDDLPDWEAADLFESSLAVLGELADVFDVPVLVTADEGIGGRAGEDSAGKDGAGENSAGKDSADPAPADLLADYADAEIECTRTDEGLRYASEDFETTVYLADGYWQTTIPYWVELFGAVVEDDPAIAAQSAGLVETLGV